MTETVTTAYVNEPRAPSSYRVKPMERMLKNCGKCGNPIMFICLRKGCCPTDQRKKKTGSVKKRDADMAFFSY